MVNIKIEFDNRRLTLPVNPEELNISRSADNEQVKIVGLGNIVVKKDSGLKNLSIESFFPSPNSEFYTGVSPKACVDFINTIWKSEKVAKIITEGLPNNINMYFVIDNFDVDSKAGEEDDIYYTLELTEYIPYGAKIVKYVANTNTGIISSNNRVDTKASTNRTYTVVSGDNLSAITKKLTGDSSKWRELYNTNIDVIGSNPNLIKPGMVLTIPDSWITGNTNYTTTKSNAKATTQTVTEENDAPFGGNDTSKVETKYPLGNFSGTPYTQFKNMIDEYQKSKGTGGGFR